MNPFTMRSIVVVGLASGIGWTVLRAESPPPATSARKAQNAIVHLTQNLKDDNVSEQARKIVKDHESSDISAIFRARNGGGLGVGKLTEIGFRDSVQHLIGSLSSRRNTTEQMFDQYQVDFLHVAQVLQAMAELAPHRATTRIQKDPKLFKEWLETTSDFKQKTGEFRTAIEEKDPKKVRLAARALNDTCCHCHNLVDF